MSVKSIETQNKILYSVGGILLGAALLVTGVSVLFFLNSFTHFIHVGTITNLTIGFSATFVRVLLVGVSCALIYIASRRQTKHKKLNIFTKIESQSTASWIRGKVYISNPREAGALGNNLKIVDPTILKIERTDGIDWKSNSNEIMVPCGTRDMKVKSELKSLTTVYLPMCLFIDNDGYNSPKKEGDVIKFKLNDELYELEIARYEVEKDGQLYRGHDSFNTLLTQCQGAYHANLGRPVWPIRQESPDEFSGSEETYPLPANEVEERQNYEEVQAMIKAASVYFKFPEMTRPKILSYRFNGKRLTFHIPGITQKDQIHIYKNGKQFAVYVNTRDVSSSRSYIVDTLSDECEIFYFNHFANCGDFDDIGIQSIQDGIVTLKLEKLEKGDMKSAV